MTDPRDSCCLAQFCTGATIGPGPFNVPTPVPTLKINAITGQYHIPTPKPGLPTPTKLGIYRPYLSMCRPFITPLAISFLYFIR